MINNSHYLRRLLVFAAVARNRSFTKAAGELGITKSAASQQIKHLETDLGVRVLNRTTRGVSLTAVGERLLERCQHLHDQVDQIFVEILHAGVAPKGRFAITCPHAVETRIVIPALEQFCLEYPGLQPEMIVSDSTFDLVEHSLDLSIYAGALADSSYHALPVGALREVFCASPLYLNRTSTPQNPDELFAHRWIATSWQNEAMHLINQRTGENEQLRLKRFAQTNTSPAALEMALRHLGVVLIPDILAQPLVNKGDLVHILCDYTGPHWPVYSLHAYGRAKPDYVDRFHQLVKQRFGDLAA